MEPVLKCLVVIAGASVFGLPLDLGQGPPKELPPLSRYQPPIFPDELRLTLVADGFAEIVLSVEDDGSIGDVVALAASHPAFVDAVREAVDGWRFQAAASATVPRREQIRFEFKRTGMISTLNQREASKTFFPETPAPGAAPVRTVAWADLETPPKRIVAAAPAYPDAFRERPIRGHARVSFIIDGAGQVRVPAVVGASEPEFGRAALDAVRVWRFDPPRHQGEAVHVAVERSFTFGANLRE